MRSGRYPRQAALSFELAYGCPADDAEYLDEVCLHDGSSSSPLNMVPRDGARFFNLQAQQLLATPGVNRIYVAMFDEVDEGTAMFKLAKDDSMAPAGVPMVTLDIDGYSIASHRYLQLAGSITQALRDQQPLP